MAKKTEEKKPAVVGIRPDQEEKLAALAEKLLDVFLEEADPEQFVKIEETASAKEQQQQRGDRCWQKKDANQTITLVSRIEALLQQRRQPAGGNSGDDDGDGKRERDDIRAIEKKARGRLALVKKRA